MEQTLGKRITAQRRKLGLTQDQLAEKLGVTAQAVSKWENDQSCPDITTLPKLADIFGITTDELLGVSSAEPVHEAEVVSEDADEESGGIHICKNILKSTADTGKKSSLGIAVWVLLVGGLMLAVNLLDWRVGMWDILWPSGLLIFGIFGLFPSFSFFRLGCALFGAYFLLDNLRILPFAEGNSLLLPVFLLLFGLSLLADALRKPKKSRFRISSGDDEKQKHSEYRCSTDGEDFHCTVRFCERNAAVVLSRMSRGDIHVSFGECTVDLSGVADVSDGCAIEADCSFGDLQILVPRRYMVHCEDSTSFGDVSIRGQSAPKVEGTIRIVAKASFGDITISYI